MSDEHFVQHYPAGVKSQIDPSDFKNLVTVFEEFSTKYADRPAYSCMGRTITYAELDQLSAQFAAYLQNETELQPGDRVAVQLPNILQFPIVFWGAMRAGMVVVNTNPLYTEREMEHQFNDSGAKLLVVYAGMAAQALRVRPKTDLKHVLVTEIADMHPGLKRSLINFVVRKVKKMVPDYDRSAITPLRTALAAGKSHTLKQADPDSEDIAVLQYTGGTTGVAKGAMLTHKNLVANLLQAQQFLDLTLKPGQEIFIAPLPLYHIFAFLLNGLLIPTRGSLTVLIPNPRDLKAFVKELSNWKFTGMAGLNTLFVALANNEDFKKLDFSEFHFTISGGMALTRAAAVRWQEVTGCEIVEGYGMTETSPVISVNPATANQLGTVGLPVPSTAVKIIDADGNELPKGEPGELCVKGPQVMKGYWNRPEATAETIDEDGYIHTGDVAVWQEDEYLRIVDRLKDMIIVSGFNVYPNEVEEVVVSHPHVTIAAAIGIEDEKTGEAIKIYAVVNKPIEAEELIEYCRQHLTGYKVPRHFEFRDELPTTNVGKVLRRELRDS